MELSGIEWNGMGWNGMEWNGMEWNRMRSDDGFGWEGIGLKVDTYAGYTKA